MGDFSVACCVSRIPMFYNRVVVVPLIPQRGATKDGNFVFDRANIVSNEGSMALFRPFTLPVFGTLRGCGEPEDIERNDNTEAIESFFWLPY